jgi:hypothetical protein
LFGLIDATSNCGEADGACAAIHVEEPLAMAAIAASPAKNERLFRMAHVLDVIVVPLVSLPWRIRTTQSSTSRLPSGAL